MSAMPDLFRTEPAEFGPTGVSVADVLRMARDGVRNPASLLSNRERWVVQKMQRLGGPNHENLALALVSITSDLVIDAVGDYLELAAHSDRQSVREAVAGKECLKEDATELPAWCPVSLIVEITVARALYSAGLSRHALPLVVDVRQQLETSSPTACEVNADVYSILYDRYKMSRHGIQTHLPKPDFYDRERYAAINRALSGRTDLFPKQEPIARHLDVCDCRSAQLLAQVVANREFDPPEKDTYAGSRQQALDSANHLLEKKLARNGRPIRATAKDLDAALAALREMRGDASGDAAVGVTAAANMTAAIAARHRDSHVVVDYVRKAQRLAGIQHGTDCDAFKSFATRGRLLAGEQ